MTTEQATPAPTPATGGLSAAALVPWAAQVLVAVILAQTLYFKFTYAPETWHVFGPLGGRPVATLVGLAELACVILLLTPATAAPGAALALGVIGGAILTHLTVLGVEVKNPDTGEDDGGLLFVLALVVAAGSCVVLWFRWQELPFASRPADAPPRGR